nr:hypothetical protein Itr_chr05CG10520 [Ipomoea trifida]
MGWVEVNKRGEFRIRGSEAANTDLQLAVARELPAYHATILGTRCYEDECRLSTQ